MTVGVDGFLGPMKRLTIEKDEARRTSPISTDLPKTEIERAAKIGG